MEETRQKDRDINSIGDECRDKERKLREILACERGEQLWIITLYQLSKCRVYAVN